MSAHQSRSLTFDSSKTEIPPPVGIFFRDKKIFDLYKSKELCDVTLVVGEDKKNFKTHKFLLSLYSDKFKAMFYDPTAETIAEDTFSDDEPDIFEIFIRYMHSEILMLTTVDEAISALYFADKYEIKSMMTDTVNYLECNLSANSILEVYEAAVELKHSQLIRKSRNYIKEHTSEILMHESFTTKNYDTVIDIISENALALNSEMEVYNAVIKWGKAEFEVNDPQVLRDKIYSLIQMVRFRSMSYLEFAGICMDGILTKDEQLQIFKEKSGVIAANSLRIKLSKKKRIFYLFSSCCYFSECKKHLLSEEMSDDRITIKQRFCSRLDDLSVWGVCFRLFVKFEHTLPNVREWETISDIQIDAKANMHLSIENITSKDEDQITVPVTLKKCECFDETETISVTLKSPVKVRKTEIFEINLYLSLKCETRITEISYCINDNLLYHKLEIINTNDVQKHLSHFTAVLASII